LFVLYVFWLLGYIRQELASFFVHWNGQRRRDETKAAKSAGVFPDQDRLRGEPVRQRLPPTAAKDLRCVSRHEHEQKRVARFHSLYFYYMQFYQQLHSKQELNIHIYKKSKKK
jgi:hypothetical protein